MLASIVVPLSFICWLISHHHLIHAEQHSVDTFGEFETLEDGFAEDSGEADVLSHESEVIFVNEYDFPIDVLWKDPLFPFDQVYTPTQTELKYSLLHCRQNSSSSQVSH